ncbi:transcription factor Adf-1-like [Contarinia nasturtii]|uniref:transcription factor Adf-1-like n=1 Tax=Contarinia nasturtii TaxID=265458 RepID=UPI0012D4B0A4|nr:transcription factor Adf-1-like [Contarinia nasturtii]
MSKKIKFSLVDEEKIIEFVKTNEILYNVRHAKFRDAEAKNRLWLKLAESMGMEVDVVKKKWVAMRDYFVRSRDKKGTGSAASSSATSKRDESLMFLLQTSVLSRASLSSMSSSPSTNTEDNVQTVGEDVLTQQIDNFSTADTQSNASGYDDQPFSPGSSVSQTPSSNKRKRETETNDILREFMATRPKPADFFPPKSPDELDTFFESLAKTMRKFSPLVIAKLKLKMSQMVGEEEIAWAENSARIEQQNLEFIYLPVQTPSEPQQQEQQQQMDE